MEFASRSRKIRRSAARFITPSRGERVPFINRSFYMTLDLTFSNLASNNPQQPPDESPTTLDSFSLFFYFLLPLSFFPFSLAFRIEKLAFLRFYVASERRLIKRSHEVMYFFVRRYFDRTSEQK